MSENELYELVVIGGSAGSIPIISALLAALPADFLLPIVIVLHRQKNVESELWKLLKPKGSSIRIIEPEDKQPVENNHVYLAPQNYHLLLEKDKSFSLDYSEAVQFSRPSIDVSFESCSQVYKNKLLAILLSGANNDGTIGVQVIAGNGGKILVQDPATAEYPKMVQSALDKCPAAVALTPVAISDYLIRISKQK